MFEIITLPKQGNPDTDWSVSTKRYVKRGNAQKAMYRALHSGLYQSVILLDTVLQNRDEVIGRMTSYLKSDYHMEQVALVNKLNGV